MAHVKLLENATSLVRHVYLVDAAVGRGSPNRRDDVLLVQFFLHALWGTKPDKDKPIGGGGPAPAIDGICGARTIEAIQIFQRWYWRQPATGGFTDGKVEPLPFGRSVGPRRQNPYTIIGLNVNYGAEYGIDRHAVLSRQPNFPAELKPKFFVG